MKIINSLAVVNDVLFEESLEQKREYIKKYNADILIMGDDWKGKFDYLNDICKVIYLTRTKEISTTKIINDIVNKFET